MSPDPDGQRLDFGEQLFTVDGFLTAEACRELIEWSEATGYEAATVNTLEGHRHLPDWRNNTRVMVDDTERATALWERVRPLVPARILDWRAVGVNERLRFYRYDVGQQFDWHSDGAYERPNGERSFYTFMVYLNEGYEGGATDFEADRPRGVPACTVAPHVGEALFFKHRIPHRGAPVLAGRKYVLRTDVMYAPADGGSDS